ncbi:MAG TPA: tRNA pseudouridine(38-40) synthase TruA [Nitrospirae bacterium]|nr:tRNA pseudouridine(38-40) synthase TruA [Nitrospirota bacterium]
MKHIRLTIQYDGTGYAGWQVQPDMPTIQGLLEGALEQVTGENTQVISAGRTDAGVHAIEQVASFRSSSRLTPEVFQRALNSLLPPDIRIMDAGYCSDGFNPRYSARSKRYFYLIDNSAVQSPFLSRYSYHFHGALDLGAMRVASGPLIGRYDFRSFQGSGCGARTTTREIYRIEITQLNEFEVFTVRFHGRLVRIAIEANAFLRHMVRNIAGTLLEVGRGVIDAQAMERIVLGRDRRLAGPTAPACGLFLEWVAYPQGDMIDD